MIDVINLPHAARARVFIAAGTRGGGWGGWVGGLYDIGIYLTATKGSPGDKTGCPASASSGLGSRVASCVLSKCPRVSEMSVHRSGSNHQVTGRHAVRGWQHTLETESEKAACGKGDTSANKEPRNRCAVKIGKRADSS